MQNDRATPRVKYFQQKRGRRNFQSGKQLESAGAYLLKKKLTLFDNRKGSNFEQAKRSLSLTSSKRSDSFPGKRFPKVDLSKSYNFEFAQSKV
jgi:hypothetical protein